MAAAIAVGIATGVVNGKFRVRVANLMIITAETGELTG